MLSGCTRGNRRLALQLALGLVLVLSIGGWGGESACEPPRRRLPAVGDAGVQKGHVSQHDQERLGGRVRH